MYNHCIISDCNSSRKNARLHVIPSSEPRRQKWLDSINSYSLRSLSDTDLSKSFVCYKHFESRFMTSTMRLTIHAYPSLFCDEEISSGKPSLRLEDTENRLIDHSYVRKIHNDHSYSMAPLSSLETCKENVEDPIPIAVPCSSHSSIIPETLQMTDFSDTTESVSDNLHNEQSYIDTEKSPLAIDPIPIAVPYSFQSSIKPETLQMADTTQSVSGSIHNEQRYTYTYIDMGKSSHAIDPTLTAMPTSSHSSIMPETLQMTDTTQSESSSLLNEQSHINTNIDMEKAPLAIVSKTKAPMKAPKRRLIHKMSELSPKTKELYIEYKKLRKQNFALKAKRSLKFSFEKLTKKMNAFCKKIFWMQIKLSRKKHKARRFTLEEKILSLAIFKQSPKCYNFLKKIFILPSRTTLKKKVNMERRDKIMLNNF